VDQLELFRNYKNVYIHKGFGEDDINSLYKYAGEQFSKSPQKNTETQVYSYFGQDEVINHDIFKNKTREAEILKKVLLDKGKDSYIGDITIPQNNQKVKLYKFYRGINERTQDSLYANLTFRFKKIDIEIRDGYFHDIRVFLEDEEYNTHVFTNLIGISLLNYYKRSLPIYFIWGTNNNKFLNYQYSIRKNTPEMLEYTDTKLINFCIKATDVLRYTY